MLDAIIVIAQYARDQAVVIAQYARDQAVVSSRDQALAWVSPRRIMYNALCWSCWSLPHKGTNKIVTKEELY